MLTHSFNKKQMFFWGLLLVVLWAGVAFLFIQTSGNLSIEQLLRFQPKNKLLAALVMCGLFLLKSVDFVMHISILYALNGIMYPLSQALLLNTLGCVIMFTVPYFIGKTFGPPLMDRIQNRYPRFRRLLQSGSNDFTLALLLRCVGLPYNVGSLYFGARGTRYLPYLLGSLAGALPGMVPYTLMGQSAHDPRSPLFIGSLCLELLFSLSALVFMELARRRRKREAHAQAR